jgi:Na+-driven multidrug efflux pump
LQIYTDDLNLAAAAIPSVYVISLATVLGAVGMVFFEAVSGTGNTSAAMALEFGVCIAYLFYAYIMTRTSSVAGVWTVECFYNLAMGFIAFCYIWKADWRKKVI